MKIVFSIDNKRNKFMGYESDKLGGAWYVSIKLCKELAKLGHRVYSFQNCPNEDPQGEMVDGVKVVHRKYLKDFLSKSQVDVYVGQREIPIVRKRYNIKQVYYHLHNTPMAEHPGKLLEWLKIGAIDKVIFVSQWHSDLAKKIPAHQKYVIPNGTEKLTVKGRKKKNRIIWASNPTRGLKVLAKEIFPEVKKQIPKVELHVAGGHSIYDRTPNEANGQDKKDYSCLYDGDKLKDGMFHHGVLNQQELAQFMHDGTLLVYPLTNRSETGSIITVQSQMYLTPCIVKNECVFPELVNVSRGMVLNNLDVNMWITTIANMLKDNELYKSKKDGCKKWRSKYEWKNIVKNVDKDFRGFVK